MLAVYVAHDPSILLALCQNIYLYTPMSNGKPCFPNSTTICVILKINDNDCLPQEATTSYEPTPHCILLLPPLACHFSPCMCDHGYHTTLAPWLQILLTFIYTLLNSQFILSQQYNCRTYHHDPRNTLRYCHEKYNLDF